jgi:hypothetical protein
VSSTSDTVSQLAKNKAAGEAFEVQTMDKLQETQSGVNEKGKPISRSQVKANGYPLFSAD